MSTNEQFQAFIDACEDLRKSKIILADAKVSAIVRSIVSNPALVEVVGEALVGYNFAHELEMLSGSKSGISLPSEPYRVIAFVFSLLSEVDARRIDLQEFVDEHFEAESLAESFERFNNEVMIPFRECLCTWVSSGAPRKNSIASKDDTISNDSTTSEDDDNKECNCGECQEGNIDTVDEFFANIEVILTQIKDTIALDSKIKKDKLADLNITLNAMFEATAMQNFRIFNALLISLNNMLRSVKSVRFYHMELQNTVADFYLNNK